MRGLRKSKEIPSPRKSKLYQKSILVFKNQKEKINDIKFLFNNKLNFKL